MTILVSKHIFKIFVLLAFGFAVVQAQNLTPQSNDQVDSSVMQNAPVSNILDAYEALSGMHLIRDNAISSVPNMTINGTGMNKEQLLQFIRSSLQINGVAMVPVDEHTLKVIVSSTPSKNLKSEGVPIYTDVKDLPGNDSVVTFCAPLNNIAPTEAVTILSTYCPPHTYGSYVPAPTAEAILITENANTVRKLLTILELIDIAPAQVTTQFIQLQRADASKVVETLTKLTEPASGGELNTTAPRANTQNLPPGYTNPGAPIAAPQGPSEKSLLIGTARFSADDRSNQVLVITRPVNLPFIRKIIAELDGPSDFAVAHRRSLNFVLAGDILPAIIDGLAQGKDESDQGKSVASNRSNTSAPAQQAAPVAQSNGSSADSGSPSIAVPALSPPQQNEVPQVVSVGKTKIMADDRSNSIIVFGTPDNVDRVFSIIDQLDKRPLQVYLATVIGQLNISDSSEFGIDLLQKYLKNGGFGYAGSSLVSPNSTAAAAVPEPTSLISSSTFPITSPGTLGGLTLYGALGSTLNAYVRALKSTGHFKIIARPSVYTTNNQLALIATGQQVPVPTNTLSGFTGTSNNSLTTSASVGYKNVVLSLEIVPRVSANHQVTLQVQQQNDTVGSSVQIGGNSVPTINTQQISTQVTVNDKSTVVIGGLISENVTTNSSGVPYLEDIPIVGHFFKDITKSKSRNELIIMIQPTVIETDSDQLAVNQAEMKRTQITGDIPAIIDPPVAPIAKEK